ncbi:hypothetical protein A0H81_02351 [Grifola frondosa]|uniref:Uncharacterized protein n=1 Tax=Grifola frondosa TaxID=5627 RepID=A0A1C7MR46_GRIFR|nr:hypothetical protein A0H81_02351 [Grifola frondosa]
MNMNGQSSKSQVSQRLTDLYNEPDHVRTVPFEITIRKESRPTLLCPTASLSFSPSYHSTKDTLIPNRRNHLRLVRNPQETVCKPIYIYEKLAAAMSSEPIPWTMGSHLGI